MKEYSSEIRGCTRVYADRRKKKLPAYDPLMRLQPTMKRVKALQVEKEDHESEYMQKIYD
jgi:hypothetical protein